MESSDAAFTSKLLARLVGATNMKELTEVGANVSSHGSYLTVTHSGLPANTVLKYTSTGRGIRYQGSSSSI